MIYAGRPTRRVRQNCPRAPVDGKERTGKWFYCFSRDEAWAWLCAQPPADRDLYEYPIPGHEVYPYLGSVIAMRKQPLRPSSASSAVIL